MTSEVVDAKTNESLVVLHRSFAIKNLLHLPDFRLLRRTTLPSTHRRSPTSSFTSIFIIVLIANIANFHTISALEPRPPPILTGSGGGGGKYEGSADGGAGFKPTPNPQNIVRRRQPRQADGSPDLTLVTIAPTAEPRLVRVRPPAEQRLYSYLFDSPSAYLKHVRPVIDHSTSVKVRLGVCIMTVDDIVEKDQTMLSTGCVKMKWTDEVLRWDPARFDNLTWIVIPSTEIWIPDVALVNSPDPFHMTKKVSNVELSFTGEVGYYPSGRFSTRCPVTLTYFPFDAQLCELQFESWAYPVQQLELVAWPVEPVDMKSFVTNHQWLLDGVNVQPLQTFYDGFNFSTIRFHFFFHRRSLYYTVYAVYPCLLMAALQLFSHTLPVEHPGRMALLTSLFIGSSVVQSSITASMPKSSDGVSVIQVYLMLYSGSLLLSIIITAVNMHIFYRTPDDSSPGIIPLFSSFLLTFGIRPMQKPPPPDAGAVKAANNTNNNISNKHASVTSTKATSGSNTSSSLSSTLLANTRANRTSNLSNGSAAGRRRKGVAKYLLSSSATTPSSSCRPSSTLVVGLENETITAVAVPSQPPPPQSNKKSPRVSTSNTKQPADVADVPPEPPASPSLLDMLGDEDSYIDEVTPPGSRASSSYYLATSNCNTVVKPALKSSNEEPVPPPQMSPLNVVRSKTTPSMQATSSSTNTASTPSHRTNRRLHGLGSLMSRTSPGRNRSCNKQTAGDWADTNRRYSVTPAIFSKEQSPVSKMIATGAVAGDCTIQEEVHDGSDFDDELFEAHPADIGMADMNESMMPADGVESVIQLAGDDSEQQLLRRRAGSSKTAALPSPSPPPPASKLSSSNQQAPPTSSNEEGRNRTKSGGSASRNEKAEQAARVRIRHAWLTYAAIIDKFFFYTMGVVNFFAPVILFLIMPAMQRYPGTVSMQNMLPTPDNPNIR